MRRTADDIGTGATQIQRSQQHFVKEKYTVFKNINKSPANIQFELISTERKTCFTVHYDRFAECARNPEEVVADYLQFNRQARHIVVWTCCENLNTFE